MDDLDVYQLSRSPIHVGIVAFHFLAACHLADLVTATNRLIPVILTDEAGSNMFPPDARVVIVIDLWDMLFPISEFLNRFTTAIPGCMFLALDRSRKPTEIVQLFQAGFSGFVSYGDVRQQVAAAITAIADGGFWAPPQVMRMYLDTTSRRAGIGHRNHTLTLRENQVLELLQKRYSNKEIARLLGISESTAKFHVSNVLAKVNVTSRRALALNQLTLALSHTVLRRGCQKEDRSKGKMLANG